MFKTDFIADEGRLAKGRKRRKAWPADCLWPEPVWDGNHGGMQWSVDDVDIMTLDEEAKELLEIRVHFAPPNGHRCVCRRTFGGVSGH